MPNYCILLFLILYVYSSLLYPGGSQESISSLGFNWIHNYWCNLTSEIAMNGMPNPGRPFAIAAMIILCLGLMVFFSNFSKVFSSSIWWHQIIEKGGFLSMLFAIFIFTEYHDLLTILSSIFGLFVVLGIIKEIYKTDLNLFKVSGLICLIFLALNNYIYYTKQYLEFLPLLQKISLAFVLLWILGLNFQLIKRSKYKF